VTIGTNQTVCSLRVVPVFFPLILLTCIEWLSSCFCQAVNPSPSPLTVTVEPQCHVLMDVKLQSNPSRIKVTTTRSFQSARPNFARSNHWLFLMLPFCLDNHIAAAPLCNCMASNDSLKCFIIALENAAQILTTI